MKRQLNPITHIERLQKNRNTSKSFSASIIISDGDDKIFNTIHQTSLENILKKLVVIQSSPRLNFHHNPPIGANRIGVEILVDRVVQPEQNWDFNFLVSVLTLFDMKSRSFQMGSNNSQNSITRKIVLW